LNDGFYWLILHYMNLPPLAPKKDKHEEIKKRLKDLIAATRQLPSTDLEDREIEETFEEIDTIQNMLVRKIDTLVRLLIQKRDEKLKDAPVPSDEFLRNEFFAACDSTFRRNEKYKSYISFYKKWGTKWKDEGENKISSDQYAFLEHLDKIPNAIEKYEGFLVEYEKGKEERAKRKERSDTTLPNFTLYMTNPPAKKIKNEILITPDFRGVGPLPWEDGPWDEEGFVTISENSTKVTFKFQHGPFLEVGENGCYPIQMQRFLKCLYSQYPVKDRYTNLMITEMERVLLWDVSRSVDRHEQRLLGTGK
jgi:hypothetical protein